MKNGRLENMDSLLLADRREQAAVIAVVCDGVGSMEDGSYAAHSATKTLAEWFAAPQEGVDRIGLRMRDAVLAINSRIRAHAAQNNLNTASTLSALLIIQDAYYIVHAGDSRIYSFDGNALCLLTIDDVSDTGKLTNCIGRIETPFLFYAEGNAAGKTFLVCSDGLYKNMDEGFLIEKLRLKGKRGIKNAADALAEYAVSRGETDNISLALIKMEG